MRCCKDVFAVVVFTSCITVKFVIHEEKSALLMKMVLLMLSMLTTYMMKKFMVYDGEVCTVDDGCADAVVVFTKYIMVMFVIW